MLIFMFLSLSLIANLSGCGDDSGGDSGGGASSSGASSSGDTSWTAVSTTSAPSARYGHTAVWTGSEMIVWGGTPDGATVVNTGGKYNPSTDSWTATTTTSAPTARAGEGVWSVWTGTEMIIWGGMPASLSTVLNTGGKYNPSANSWTATTTTGAPTAREANTTVWTGSEMIVWGGWNGPATYFNTGGRYNPTADSWTATSTTNAPSARQSHKAVWTGTGGVMIVWGGTADDVSGLNTGGRYNPTTDSWTATSTTNAPAARYIHTAVWTGTQMIVWGGKSSNSATSSLNTGGRYTP